MTQMFEAVVHAWRIRKLHSEKKRIQALYRTAVAEARAAKKPELELERLFFEERMEVEIQDAEIHSLVTQRLIQLADHYLIPLSLNPREELGSDRASPAVGI
jgi:hypothetical protein